MKTQATRAPGRPGFGPEEQRGLLGRLAALVGAPLLLGSRAAETVASVLEGQAEQPNRTPGGVRIAAPDHSVKRRG